jgi:hypothetical protein
MDIDVPIKIGGLALGAFSSAFATWKIFFEMLHNKKNIPREDYKFAKEFLDFIQVNNGHPYITQLGYLALSGDMRAGHEEIKYAISMTNPRAALRDYLLGKSYVEYFSTSSPQGFAFKESYRSKKKRSALKYFYRLSYFVTYMAGFSPLLIVSFRLASPGVSLPFFVFTAITFFPLGYLSLKESIKLEGAELLIRQQTTCRDSRLNQNQ